jgi:hypothetical protein
MHGRIGVGVLMECNLSNLTGQMRGLLENEVVQNSKELQYVNSYLEGEAATASDFTSTQILIATVTNLCSVMY